MSPRAVIRRGGQLLLARQRTKFWSFLPGGHVEPGERVEVTLVREIAEELGAETKIDVRPGGLKDALVATVNGSDSVLARLERLSEGLDRA